MLDRDCDLDTRALVPWKSRGLAILLPLRDYPASVDVSLVGWQRPAENVCDRSFAFHRIGRN